MLQWVFVVIVVIGYSNSCSFLQGWVVASDSVMDTSYTVRSLQPDTSYMFLVRAQNSHGLSLPSPVTSAIRTRGTPLPL